MLRIAICDDMENSVHEVKGYISEVCEKLNIQTEITAYYSGEELCKSLESGTHYDIVFLDIEM
ncbi:MAG: DNA-binding response regulator, partial [Oscillospiraceae bacterium]|nr:DNA-binding response regulator [Oscillospiraceae bacterium]